MTRSTFAGSLFRLFAEADDDDVADLYTRLAEEGTFNRVQLEAWLRDPPAEKPMYADLETLGTELPRGMPNLELTEEHQIVALSVGRVGEHGAIRKRLEERGHLALHGLLRALVELHEERDDTTGIAVLLDLLEEFARVERGGADAVVRGQARLQPLGDTVALDEEDLLLQRLQRVQFPTWLGGCAQLHQRRTD